MPFGHKSTIWNSSLITILNFIELKNVRAYPSLKLHILFYSNGLTILI